VVGREAERLRIHALAAGLAGGLRALVIGGEPGIGKTALWLEAVDYCRRAEFEVLRTRPAEEEMPLAAVGLIDLLERAGLDPDGLRADGDPLARGRAVLEALRRLAERRPVVVAIDDVQWLDAVSARALRYALRRLETEPVGVLAAARLGRGEPDPLGLAATLQPGGYEELERAPLSLGATSRADGLQSRHRTRSRHRMRSARSSSRTGRCCSTTTRFRRPAAWSRERGRWPGRATRLRALGRAPQERGQTSSLAGASSSTRSPETADGWPTEHLSPAAPP
jgi:AAA ATPase domain